jgi:hypothetical protein
MGGNWSHKRRAWLFLSSGALWGLSKRGKREKRPIF